MLTLRTTAIVTKINRKSSSPCFKNLKVGDVIEFSVPISYAGYTSHGTCATYIKCYNRRIGTESRLSFNQLDRVLECCELVECDNAIADDEIKVICQDGEKILHLKPNKAELEFVSPIGLYERNEE